MNKEEILKEVKAFAKENIANLQFHNYEHTVGVVEGVLKIGEGEGVSEEDLFVLELAAWFHDTGYSSSKCSGHEKESVETAEKLLAGKVSEDVLERVKGCIWATQLFQSPKTKLEEIISDADLSHLGKDKFYETAEALRKEKADCPNEVKYSKKQWLVMNLQFLSEHKYHTDYAKKLYQAEKEKRVIEIKEKVDALITKKGGANPSKVLDNSVQKPRRDIETMFRVLSRNQLGLSAIADRKASILLSINTMITSFAVGYLFRKIDEYPQLEIPSYIFAITGLISVILAVIATRPNVGKLNFSKSSPKVEPDPKSLNLLFFENFVDMPLEDYQEALMETNKTPLKGCLLRSNLIV